ncbi:C-C motif chemokine 4-like [Elgaria multicarinata webbii]|uniref:C-C motif chemokine 4-like n=1 Tax=Elgaria multicarinata webbii TaxID=159646 RepID=UPI002FCCDD08
MKSSSPSSSSSSCALALLLLLLLALCASSAPVGSDPPTSCCFTYTLRKLPRNFVTSYYQTSSRCSKPGVVFITRKGRQVCANPTDRWVQEYVNQLELN